MLPRIVGTLLDNAVRPPLTAPDPRGSARSRAALQLEVLAVRHQLQVLQRTRPRRLRLTKTDRWLWVGLFHDPENPVSIWEIGLIYGIKVNPSGAVGVRMTLTSPNCPSAAELPQEVERKVKAIGGVIRGDGRGRLRAALGAVDDVGGGQTPAEYAVTRTLRGRLIPRED